MSQAGTISVTGAVVPPNVPISFVTNAGTAVSALNVMNVLGVGGLTTSGAGNTISINFSGAVFVWNDVTTATQTLAAQNGYVTDRAGGVTYTLPNAAAFGEEFIITGKLGLWSLAQNAGQQVVLANGSTTIGIAGSLTATNIGDSIKCVAITAGVNSVWRAYEATGNLTVV
jgi:hypothetical protein